MPLAIAWAMDGCMASSFEWIVVIPWPIVGGHAGSNHRHPSMFDADERADDVHGHRST
jgi:hypothetical protein